MPGWLARRDRRGVRASSRGDDAAPVAVRSSATAEDTESASFAGMNETFLNVRGADAVVDAVRRCWASLFGARTVFYRAKRGFAQADMDIAVVVQRQIQSTRAGVMFTIDPASGPRRPHRDRGRLRARRERRLGQRLARPLRGRQGDARRSSTREVKQQGAGDRAASPAAARVTRELGGDEAHAPVLDRRRGPRAGRAGGAGSSAHYGAPQDTEWAFDPDGNVWMLQSRPVTSAGGDRRRPSRHARAARRSFAGLGAAPGRARAAACA